MSEDQLKYYDSNFTYLGGFDQVNEPSEAYGRYSRIHLIRRGLPLSSLNFLLQESKLNRQELAHILQISPRTMQRYSAEHMLPSTVSEKLLMLNDLYERGHDILGQGPENVTHWLRSHVIALGNQRPIDYLDTYEGFNEVLKVLGRLEWGIVA